MKGQGIFPGQYYSNQMNIAVFVDVRKALAMRTLTDAVYAMDNSGHSIGNGTPNLSTTCKNGTVLNWLIYGIDSECRPDGSYPSMPVIRNIVFKDGETDSVALSPICDRLGCYGGPDKSRSEYTPAYSYWAGCLRMDLSEGIYRYRIVVELNDAATGQTICMDIDGLSLRVVRQ